MRKSIFTKYFLICSAVILISFFCLGAVLLLVSSQYFVGEKKNQLSHSSQSVVADAQSLADAFDDGWQDKIENVIKGYSLTSTNGIIITDSAGRIISSTNDIGFKSNILFINGEYATSVNENGDYFRSSMGIFKDEQHIVRRKFSCNDADYYVFAVCSVSEQDEYITNIMQLFGISALVVAIFAIIIIYIGIVHAAKPVQQLAAAAKRFGQGDFSEKIEIADTAEFAELGTALNDMAVSLSNMEFMRKSFIANVSHELRTPMTSIGGFIDGMLDGTIKQNEYKKYFRIISSEVHRLTRLVRSMLNLSKIEAGDMDIDYSEFSIIEPVVDTLVTFESKLEDKNIEIIGLDTSRMMVYADNDLIHQVVYNLIENAVKFTNKDGFIEFSFIEDEETTWISIKNSGDGISEEELPLIFDRFYKVDQSRGKDAKGVGLGLYIVRSIINLHGGNVTVKSKMNEYTEFILSLPKKQTQDSQ